MKRILSLVLTASLVLSLAACGGAAPEKEKEIQAATSVSESITEAAQEKEESLAETTDEDTATSAVETEAAESEIEDEGWDELESLGKVQTEDGILTVTITVPADLVGEDVAQEHLDAKAGENYKSATLNEDGSVTYKMTKKQHRAMMDSLVENFDESLQELVDDDETYTFTEITHNKDFTSFDVTIDAEDVGLSETFAVYVLYMYGGLYGIFSGHTPEKVIANYYNASGELLYTFDSSKMEDEE